MTKRRAASHSILFSIAMAAAAGAQTLNDPSLQVTTVASGLSLPTTMAFLGPGDFLVLQKNDGQVRRVVSGVLQAAPVLDVAVSNNSERGLLGIAINTEHPPRVFLYYTQSSVDGGAPIANRVYRYTWNSATAMLESPQLILDLPVLNGPNHDGGILTLGPTPTPGPGPLAGDGSLLHIVIGDLNRSGQLENVATGAPPDDTAVILRVLQDGSAAPGNPFVPYCSSTTTQTCPTGSGCPGGETCVSTVARYYAYGVRNSFGMAVDPVTGILWDTENGPGSYDEINMVPSGFNSGWNQLMGPDSRDPQGPGDLFAMPGGGSAYSDPEFSWLTPVAVTAIAFPAGSALGPAYESVALAGDFNNGLLYSIPLNGPRTAFDFSAYPALQDLVADSSGERDQLVLGSGFGGITDVKVGPDGAVYVVSIGNGAVYRIAPIPPSPAPSTTGSPTVTPASSPTRTPTRTPSATPTRTPTQTPSRTPSATPTISALAAPSATHTPIPRELSGRVRYYSADRPVANTTLMAQNPAPAATATDALGQYAFAALLDGNTRIEAEKNGDFNFGVSSLDASFALAVSVGKQSPDAFQQLACDVTGNGTISSLDAARILQFSVNKISRLPAGTLCDSDWAFVPMPDAAPDQILVQPQLSGSICQRGAIVYQPLAASTSAQDFWAVLFGDCTGNWEPAGGGGSSLGAARVRLGRLVRRHGNRLRLPIRIDADAFRALDMEIGYDAAALRVVAVRRRNQSTAALLEFAARTPGTLRIALAHAEPLNGHGAILDVELERVRGRRPAPPALVRAAVDERAVGTEPDGARRETKMRGAARHGRLPGRGRRIADVPGGAPIRD